MEHSHNIKESLFLGFGTAKVEAVIGINLIRHFFIEGFHVRLGEAAPGMVFLDNSIPY